MGPKKKPDARGVPKPGTKQAKAAAEAKKAQAATEEPKKPSVKEVIGGASWTGKLPVNMLAEHCQKQKWDKPEYTMVRDECKDSREPSSAVRGSHADRILHVHR